MFTAEVESAISTHSAVAEVAVVGVPDERWGEAVHAIVVPRPDQTPTVADLTAHCAPLIANYKHPPRLDAAHRAPAALRRRQGAQARSTRAVLGGAWAGRELRAAAAPCRRGDFVGEMRARGAAGDLQL